MDQPWTIIEIRAGEVLDFGVDWTDDLIRTGEASISSIGWDLDPQYAGDITLAGIPHQPRRDGNVARARAIGATRDTVWVCTATFLSGEVLKDKTYFKVIP